MTSKTIIRVKRRFEDDPINAIVLSYKRKKIEDESESTVLKLTATVDHQDDAANTETVHLYSGAKNERSGMLRAPTSNVQSKIRAENQSRSKESRFKILSLNRSVEFSDKEHVTIVDVDAQNEVDKEGASEQNYVYDLYSNEFMRDDDVDDACIEHILSVEPLYTEMEYRGSEDSEDIDPYEEDSNDEDNWRNDYPDSDHSVNDDDMRLAASLYGMGFDNGNDLSDDSEDEEYQAMSGLSPLRGYDAYKARAMRETNHVHVLDSISDDDDDDDVDNFSDVTNDVDEISNN